MEAVVQGRRFFGGGGLWTSIPVFPFLIVLDEGEGDRELVSVQSFFIMYNLYCGALIKI